MPITPHPGELVTGLAAIVLAVVLVGVLVVVLVRPARLARAVGRDRGAPHHEQGGDRWHGGGRGGDGISGGR